MSDMTEKEVHAAIAALVRKHHLGEMHNPGGISLMDTTGRMCQISGYDTEVDLAKLEDFLSHTCPVPLGLQPGDTWECATCNRKWLMRTATARVIQ